MRRANSDSAIPRWAGTEGSAGRVASRFTGALAGVAIGAVASCLLLAQTAQGPDSSELTSKETQPSFRIQTERNLVTVRVTVRDANGRAIGNLQKEDFHLFDRGKPQTITYFAVEPLAPKKPPEKTPTQTVLDPEALPEAYVAPDTPQRYLGLFFDDVHISFADLARTRDAADHYLTSTLQPGDRVGIFTASGRNVLDFTADRAKIHDVLLLLRPWPIIEQPDKECPDISDYQAFLIVHQRDTNTLQIAEEEAFVCRTQGANMLNMPRNPAAEEAAAEGEAVRVLTRSDDVSLYTLRGLEQLARRMAVLPAQRHVVFISPGFIILSLRQQLGDVIDRALRANVIINALDARGLYAPQPLGDISQKPIFLSDRPDLMGKKSLLRLDRERAASEALTSLASDTGGLVFQNNNDLNQGFRRVGALPDVSYVLAFSPQNLKFDGNFHPVKVTLIKPKGLTVQARRGYYAPKRPEDSSAQAKEEIEQAVFSKDEVNELPLTVQTQFFKFTELDAQLSVLTHVDLHLLRFRKEGERNLNNLTLVTAVFDRDGKLVTGKQKTVDFRLRDQTLEQLLRSGITVKISFDIKAGTYLVRQVVRDTEGGQLAGLNRTVEIPY